MSSLTRTARRAAERKKAKVVASEAEGKVVYRIRGKEQQAMAIVLGQIGQLQAKLYGNAEMIAAREGLRLDQVVFNIRDLTFRKAPPAKGMGTAPPEDLAKTPTQIRARERGRSKRAR